MGRPVDDERYELVDYERAPVHLRGDSFTRSDDTVVPFGDLMLAELKSTHIPGLRTKFVAAKEMYLDHINHFPVLINFLNNVEFDVKDRCFLVSGRTWAAELANKIHARFLLDPHAFIALSIDGSLILPDTRMMTLYKDNILNNGCLHLDCNFENLPEVVFDAPNFGGPYGGGDDHEDKSGKDDDVYDDGTEGNRQCVTSGFNIGHKFAFFLPKRGLRLPRLSPCPLRLPPRSPRPLRLPPRSPRPLRLPPRSPLPMPALTPTLLPAQLRLPFPIPA